MANDFELDYINFNGQEYPVRDVYVEGVGTVNVSVESLANALDPTGKFDNLSPEADYIDSKVYFYVNDADINKPIAELTKIIEENI